MATKTISTVVQELERLAPGGTAEDWDNVGLLVGDPAWKTAGAVVTIDLTAEAIQLAKKKKFKLIVTHHPCIFPKNRGLARVVGGEGRGLGMSSYVFEALREGVAVIACHTNFDQCALEVVESVSTGLGIAPQGRLMDHTQGSLLKLVVYVPEGHTDQVRKALCAAGAGQIGNYDFCTFAMPGEGMPSRILACPNGSRGFQRSGWKPFYRGPFVDQSFRPCSPLTPMKRLLTICML